MNTRLLLICVLVLMLIVPCFAGETILVKGRVVDSDGNPVSGVKVFAVMESYGDFHRTYLKAAVVSGKDGAFAFKSLPKPLTKIQYYYQLVAFKPQEYLGWAFGPNEGSVKISTPAGGYRITVSRPGVFESKVVDKEDKGIPGVTVRTAGLRMKPKNPGEYPQYLTSDALEKVVKLNPVTTDSEGIFRLTGIPAHTEALAHIEKFGYAQDPERRMITSDKPPDNRKLVMVPGGSVTGMLVDQHGTALSGVSMLARAAGHDFGYGRAITQKDGSFTINGLVPGDYYIGTTKLEDSIAKPVSVYVRAGEVAKADKIVALPGVFLSGRVVDEDSGKPVTNGSIYAYDPTYSGMMQVNSEIDGKGCYRLRVLSGTYQISFQGRDLLYKRDMPSSLKANIPQEGLEDYVIKVKKNDIVTGRILDLNGKPVANASINIDGDSEATTDASGYFKVAIPPEQKPGSG